VEIGPNKMYDKVCVRRLECDRNSQFHSTVNDYIEESYGNSYSLKAIIRNSSNVVNHSNEGTKYVDKERAFFCSEHVAKAYKILNVFDTELSSGKFWPSTLESDPLPLAKGARIGPVINIIPVDLD